MAIFGKLFAPKAPKSDHPLGSEENLALTLGEIPAEVPLRALQDIAHWLDDIQRFESEIGLPALLRASLALDALAQPARAALLDSYLNPTDREHASEQLWSEIDRSLLQAAAAYRHCLDRQQQQPHPDIGQSEIDLAAARAMRALAVRKKLARFRYRAPGADWWGAANALLSLAGLLRAAQTPVAAYAGEDERRSVLQHFLIATYFELAPLANFVPQQVEMLDRLLLHVAENLELAAAAHAASTHWLDLGDGGGPRPLDQAPPVTPLIRFLARGRLKPAITQLAGEARASGQPPDWILPPGAPPELALQLLMVLMLHWSAAPPQRATPRQAVSHSLRAVLGFDQARRMVSFSDFARSGRSLNYDGGNIDALFEENRFGHITIAGADDAAAPEVAAPVVDPIATLEKLELAGDRQMMETWLLIDVSDTGLGAEVPAVRAKHRVGGLVCLRREDGVDWSLGIIRRIGRNAAGKATAGIETLPAPPTSAQVKPADGSATGWAAMEHAGHGYRDAILLASGSGQLILPRDTFSAGLALNIRTSEQQQRGRLTELIEAGDDYERVRFEPLD